MARSQATKAVTRKSSKQLTDEERASQVASPTRASSLTIPPGEIDATIMRYPATLTEAERRSQAFFTLEMMQGIQDAQKKRPKMNPEEIDIDCEKTRLSMGMISIAIVRHMKTDNIKRAERSKQRGNTSRPSGKDNSAAVPEPFEIDNDTDENDNDSDNDNREDDLFSNDRNDDNYKGGYRDPDYANDPDDNNPRDDSDPNDDYTQSTDDE